MACDVSMDRSEWVGGYVGGAEGLTGYRLYSGDRIAPMLRQDTPNAREQSCDRHERETLLHPR